MRILRAIFLFLLCAPALAADIDNPQTNASALTTGTLAAARGGAGTINGALKGNGAGVVSQANCAALSDAGTACSSPIMRSKRITMTRDLTVASGNVAYTGIGFQPTSCSTLGSVNSATTVYATFSGHVDASLSSASLSYNATASLNTNTTFLAFADATGANNQAATVASFDADGFTLSWTKTGAPTGTAVISTICYR